MDKSQARALSDLSCATRKLAALFREHGMEQDARSLEGALSIARQAINRIKTRSKKP